MKLRTCESKGTYQKIKKILYNAQGMILDMPAGSGALAEIISEPSRTVICGEYDFAKYKFEAPCVSFDANQLFPFKDESFDNAVCCAGLGDFENQAQTLREIVRVTKPGSTVVITHPNIMNLRSRLRFLITGFFSKFKYPFHESGDATVHAASYSYLKYIIVRAGLKLERVQANRYKPADCAVFFLWPLALLGAAFVYFKHCRKQPDAAQMRKTLCEMVSPALMFGETIIITARRS